MKTGHLSLNGGNAISTATSSVIPYLRISWKTLGLGLLVALLLGIGYWVYMTFVAKKPLFYANREHVPSSTQANKSAKLMLFFADWCPHCKSAKPEWDALKEEYAGKSINGYVVQFAEYNCSDESNAESNALVKQFNVEGFPTIKLIKDDQIIDYDAKPTKSTLEQFLHSVL